MYVLQGYASEEAIAFALEAAGRADTTPLPGSVSRFATLSMDDCVRLDHLSEHVIPRDRDRSRWFIISLLPTQQIPLHVDAAQYVRRFHIPIRTSPECWCFHDGAWQQLERGAIYEMDPTKPHGAVNWSADVRWHLMVDVATVPILSAHAPTESGS